MDSVCVGAVKNQLSNSAPPMAVARAGHRPPTRATTTDASTKLIIAVGRCAVGSPSARFARVTTIVRMVASTQPVASRAGERLVDGAGADQCVDNRGARGPHEQPLREALTRSSHNELARVHGRGEIEERARDVIARKHVPRAAERFGEGTRFAHLLGRHARRAIRREDVNDEELAAGDPPGDAAATANEGGSLLAAAHGHEDPLARRPRLLDAFLAAVLLETIVDLIGEPQKRELAKRREVPLAEKLAERRIHGRGPVHLPLPQPHAQRIGAQVDQLDLLRFAQDRIGNRLVLHVARNVRDHVVEGLEVLNVHG